MIITNLEQLEPFRKKSGIYLFTDKLFPEKRYAGKAFKRLYSRIVIDHRNSNKQWIDNIIRKYGLLDRFIVELIHWWDNPVSHEEVLALEVAVIDEYNCLKEFGGYNILLFNFDRTGIKHTKKTCKKISKANSGENNYLFGNHRTEDIKDAIKKSWKIKRENKYISPNKGKKRSKKTIEKMKKNNSKYWLNKKFSKEHCNKMSKVNIGENNPKFDFSIYTFKNKITNEIFTGTRYDFYTKYNLNRCCVHEIIKKTQKSHKNWILI